MANFCIHFSRITLTLCFAVGLLAAPSAAALTVKGPQDLAITKDAKTLVVANEDSKSLDILDVASKKILRSVALPYEASGLCLSPDEKKAYVTCQAPKSKICEIDIASGKITGEMDAGHYAIGPSISPDGKTLYICNRFDDDVAVYDIASRKETRRIKLTREPHQTAITPDGKILAVCNHLTIDPSDLFDIATNVTLIDTKTFEVLDIRLPNGAADMRGICISPDGKYCYSTHILARYQMPTTQLERGWIGTNAVSIIDLEKKEYVNSVLLDDVDLGAANPWGVACSDDGKFLVTTHAGTHELSVIDRIAMHKKLDELPHKPKDQMSAITTAYAEGVPNNLSFLVGMRERIHLEGNGPRNVKCAGDKAYVNEHFSDTISVVELNPKPVRVTSIQLTPGFNFDYTKLAPERLGEMHFNDAELCFQKWVACATCHPDGRTDALNWDLLNDGLGNPKNAKSMLYAAYTAPTMITGIRPDARTCIEKGMQHIQFAVRDDAIEPILAYFKSMKLIPSPYLENGKLSKLAQEGEKVFKKAACDRCHKPDAYFQDGLLHDVKSRGDLAKQGKFNTPTLHEVWRSAPYMHDGHYFTLKELFSAPGAVKRPKPAPAPAGGAAPAPAAPGLTKPDSRGRHGQKGKGGEVDLTDKEIDALIEYVLSL